MGDVYSEAVVETFRRKAIRTAHIIDDMFPTYTDLAKPEAERGSFTETPLALELYSMFRSRKIPCDIENSTAAIKEDVERIRKSDLIVLDYNLAHEDTRTSTSLVRALSTTKHFNTVIVYTAAPDLDEVWSSVGIALRGGWGEEAGIVSADGAQTYADLVDKNAAFGIPSLALIKSCILGKNPAVCDAPDRDTFTAILDHEGVAPTLHADVLTAIVRSAVRTMLRDDHGSRDAPLQIVEGGCDPGRPRWLLSANCFVTIMKKPDGAGGVLAETLFDALDAALCEWRPNLPQIIISEIQNELELDALATDELMLRDPNTQVSLCYFLLQSLGEGAEGRTEEAVAAPLHTLLDKLVDSVRLRLVTDPGLKRLGRELLSYEIKREAVPTTFKDRGVKAQKLFQHAKSMVRAGADTTTTQAGLHLNAFLSTEPFRGELTTGTVFRHENEHFMCATPACDLVRRQPKEARSWPGELHPMKPMVAMRLTRSPDREKALRQAEFSRNIFVKIGAAYDVFGALSDDGPDYEFLFLTDGGRIAHEQGVARFNAARMRPGTGEAKDERHLVTTVFDVVGQLRPNYASRFLQQTGQWLSRIGVDFVRHM